MSDYSNNNYKNVSSALQKAREVSRKLEKFFFCSRNLTGKEKKSINFKGTLKFK